MPETPRSYARVWRQIRGAGLRPTRQRLTLAKLLFEGQGQRHVTAEALFDEACAVGARVSLATVYNTLHQFTAAGLLRQVIVDSGRTFFDTNTSDHHHFFFEDRGIVEDIPADNVRFTHLPPPPDGRKISRIDVVIRVTDETA